MDRDTIIRLAREAGAVFSADGSWHKFETQKTLERFAVLVAEHKREECAKVAESYEPMCDTCPSGVANAIRSKKC